jgi:hypothetical protein
MSSCWQKVFASKNSEQLSRDYFLLLVAISAIPITVRVIAMGIEALVSRIIKIKAANTSEPIPPRS